VAAHIGFVGRRRSFSALQRAEIAEMVCVFDAPHGHPMVSVLFNEPKLLKCFWTKRGVKRQPVSVLFNEPKLLKFNPTGTQVSIEKGFSALQRAEIAEI